MSELIDNFGDYTLPEQFSGYDAGGIGSDLGMKALIQKLSPGSLVEFFILDATAIGGTVIKFHPGVNELGNDVIWQGETYVRYPIEVSGFEWSGKGTLPRPTVRVANITGGISALVHDLDDLVGAKVTRKRTFLRYLDAENFASGNSYADPNSYLPDEIYYVDRKSNQNKIFVEFELATSWDLTDVQLPRRQCIQNVCLWAYRSAECGYSGGPVADINDVPTSDPNLDACGKRVASCHLRFGNFAVLPFGGFPGVGLIR